MGKEKRNIICSLIAAVLALSIFYAYYRVQSETNSDKQHAKVGFIYDGDASTPYSANFIRAVSQLRTEYGEKIDVVEKFNVPYDMCEEVIDDLAKEGCDIIFTNSYGYGETAKKMAEKHTDMIMRTLTPSFPIIIPLWVRSIRVDMSAVSLREQS